MAATGVAFAARIKAIQAEAQAKAAVELEKLQQARAKLREREAGQSETSGIEEPIMEAPSNLNVQNPAAGVPNAPFSAPITTPSAGGPQPGPPGAGGAPGTAGGPFAGLSAPDQITTRRVETQRGLEQIGRTGLLFPVTRTRETTETTPNVLTAQQVLQARMALSERAQKSRESYEDMLANIMVNGTPEVRASVLPLINELAADDATWHQFQARVGSLDAKQRREKQAGLEKQIRVAHDPSSPTGRVFASGEEVIGEPAPPPSTALADAITGAAGAFLRLQKKTGNRIQDELLNLDNRLLGLRQVAELFDPRFLTARGRLGAGATNLLELTEAEKILNAPGLTDPEAKEFARRLAGFRGNAIDATAAYIKSLSGAQVTDRERAFLLEALPQATDGHSKFTGKFIAAVRRSVLLSARLRMLAMEGGFDPDDTIDDIIKTKRPDLAFSIGLDKTETSLGERLILEAMDREEREIATRLREEMVARGIQIDEAQVIERAEQETMELFGIPPDLLQFLRPESFDAPR